MTTLYRYVLDKRTKSGMVLDESMLRGFFAEHVGAVRSYDATQFWLGNTQPVLVLEVYDSSRTEAFHKETARAIAREFRQDCVLLEVFEVKAHFISGASE